MDALVTAGGIPAPGEPLYEYTHGESKALIDIAGKPMIQWVMDALSHSSTIDRVVVIGLAEDCGITCTKPMVFMPNQGGMLDNIITGIKRVMEYNPGAEHVLLVSSDIPAITGEMVDWSVNTSLETADDIYYTVIERKVMEARFPGSKRTYTRLKGIEVCGGDMNMVRTSLISGRNQVWEKIISTRKNPLKQASLIGFDTLFLVIFHLITLEDAVDMVCKRLHLKGRALRSPYAEIGMDVDKPHQLEMMREDLCKLHPVANSCP